MSPSAKRTLPMLESVRVASPCPADWGQMIGDEKVRFCTGCEKNVYNLSAMTSADAEHLLGASAGGELCVRFYQRADGTVMTSDCPVGVTRKRRKKLALAVAGAGALAWGAVAQLDRRTMGTVPMTGEVAVQGAPMTIPDPVTTVATSIPVPPLLGSAVLPPEPPRTEIKGKLAVDPMPPHVMGGIRPMPTEPKPPEHVTMGRRAPSPRSGR